MPAGYLAIRLAFLYFPIPKMKHLQRKTVRLAKLTLATGLIWASVLSPACAAGGVLVVGDSLEVGTSPYLRGLLHGIPLTVDAQTSRPSSTGVAILGSRLQSGDQVVVFDLGTNDDPAQPQALAADLAAVRSIVAGRCVVVATLNRPPYNGVSAPGCSRQAREGRDQAAWPPALARSRAQVKPHLADNGSPTIRRPASTNLMSDTARSL